MLKRLLITLILILAIALPALGYVYMRLYLPGYSPFIYDKVDIYKINKGNNFNKVNPYLIPKFGTSDKRQVQIEEQQVIISTLFGDEKIYPDIILTMDEFFARMQQRTYHQSLTTQVCTKATGNATQTGGLIKDLPFVLPNIAMPKTIKRILGTKAGRLTLDGTQRISLAGTSTKRKKIPLYETNRGSRFDLKMQQDTNLRLSGTIGEKIAVNLTYNSNADETQFNPNNINIKYTGDEDEVVQSIESGNVALTLSGSKYIGASASSQGLFGITSKVKFGALDLTVIASKEEGQKNTKSYVGQSQADSVNIFSNNYENRKLFYLVDPYEMYQIDRDSTASNPRGWANNRILTDNEGVWLLADPNLLPVSGTVKVYLDNGNNLTNPTALHGEEIIVNGSPYTPHYDPLFEGTDFLTDYNRGTIQILKDVGGSLAMIAVRYIDKNGNSIPPNSAETDTTVIAKVLRKRLQTSTDEQWKHQMRNVYDLQRSNIKSDGFGLDVFTINPADATRNYEVSDTLKVPADYKKLIQYLNIDTDRDGKITGNDTTVNLTSGYLTIPMLRPFKSLSKSDSTRYESEEPTTVTDFVHQIGWKGKTGTEMLSLGQTGILKGSVKVKVNGTVQKENTDYIVDYDMGQITFLTEAGKDPEAKISIDYEFRSGFAVATKTLVGVRADWNINTDTKLGGTIVYRTEKVAEKRPKIGSENMSLFMADLDGKTSWKPGFITRWIDALPLIKTNSPSSIDITGEFAVTMPKISGDTTNPDAAYIDDMEGILDAYPLGLAYTVWSAASNPLNTSLPKGRLNWYNPKNVTMLDVYGPENLTVKEQRENTTVLAMKLFPNNISQPGMPAWSYGGIMKFIGTELDFSKKKYIELLVKVDHKGSEADPNVVFHVDLGDVSEDFYTAYGGAGVLNKEDRDHGDGNPIDGILNQGEDTGLDGIANPGGDLNDDAKVESANEFGDYPHRNGTEDNMVLDTEDLDNNGVLNTLNRYLSYSVSLADIDTTGYTLIRIPLQDPDAYETINDQSSSVIPTLKKVSFVRLWAESDNVARLLIANASIVGNKWEDYQIRTSLGDTTVVSLNESYQSGIVDNQKNEHYRSPKGTFTMEQGTQTLEQALTLQVDNLQAGHQVLLRQRLFDKVNLLAYKKIKFWVYPELKKDVQATPDTTSLDIVFRMGADELNYYQVIKRIPVVSYINNLPMDRSKWQSIEIDLQEFTKIKTELVTDSLYTPTASGLIFKEKGAPNLTNIKEFVIGVQNRNSDYSGITYFNDIRVTEPYDAMGWVGYAAINTILADFITFNAEFTRSSMNFNSNIQRGRTLESAYKESTVLRMTNKYFLNKFFPNGWGLDMPLTLSRDHTLDIPRFRASSDLLREGITDPATKAREKSETFTNKAMFSFAQTANPKSPFLAYTIRKTSFDGSITQIKSNQPTSKSQSLAWGGTYRYNLNLPENFLALPLSQTYKIHFVPGSFTNNITLNATEPVDSTWDVYTTPTHPGWKRNTNSTNTKILNTTNGMTWNLSNDLRSEFSLNTKRDLLQPNYKSNLLPGVKTEKFNVGQETDFTQNINLNYSPTYLPQVFTLTGSVAANYMENQRKFTETTSVPDSLRIYYKRDGNSLRDMGTTISLLNTTLLTAWADKLALAHPDTTATGTLIEPPQDKYGKDKDKQDASKGKKPDQKKDPLKQDKQPETELPDPAQKLPPIDEKTPEEKAKLAENLSDGEQQLPTDDKKIDLEGDGVSAVDSSQTKTPKIKKIKPKVYLPVTILRTLAKVKNVSLTFRNKYTQYYLRKEDRPNFGFQIGLPHQIPGDSLDAVNTDYTISLASGLVLSRHIDTTFGYALDIAARDASVVTQTDRITFPDVSVAVTEIDTWIGISKYVTNLRVNSSYQRLLSKTGPSSKPFSNFKPQTETITTNYTPLVAVTANLFKKLQTTVSYETTVSDNITHTESSDVLRRTTTDGITGNLQYSYSEGMGFKLPFTDRKFNIRNELTSSLAIHFTNNYDTTKRGSEKPVVDRETFALTITPGASYQFDANIKGGLTGAYELNGDKKREDGTRIFRLGIWIEIAL